METWALTICTEKTFFFPDEMSNGMVQLVKIFRIEGMPSKVFLFFHFNGNDQDHLQKSHSCHSLTHGRRFVNLGTSCPRLGHF